MTGRSSATRRQVLAAVGTFLATGCSARSAANGDADPDGPPLRTDPQSARDGGSGSSTGAGSPTANPSYGSVHVGGTEVPLVPVDAAYEWYAAQRAVFVDVRGRAAYEESRVKNAIHAPLDDNGTTPVPSTNKDVWVVYGECDHTVAAERAATFREAGVADAHALTEGFTEWYERGYPMSGSALGKDPELFVVDGQTNPRYVGETVWLTHEPTGQREAALVNARGRYRLEVRFTGVTAETEVVVETPEYVVERPLGELEDGVVGAA